MAKKGEEMHCSHIPSSPASPNPCRGTGCIHSRLSSAPGELPPGAPCMVSQEAAVMCPVSVAPPPFLHLPRPHLFLSFPGLPVLPVEFNSFSQHLPRACPSPELGTEGHRDDAGQGSALQALILQQHEYRLQSTRLSWTLHSAPFKLCDLGSTT